MILVGFSIVSPLRGERTSTWGGIGVRVKPPRDPPAESMMRSAFAGPSSGTITSKAPSPSISGAPSSATPGLKGTLITFWLASTTCTEKVGSFCCRPIGGGGGGDGRDGQG